MRVTVRLFGRFGDLGEREASIELAPGATGSDLRSLLATGNDTLGRELASPRTLVAVNRQIVDWEQPLADGDEIALLPPVTGG